MQVMIYSDIFGGLAPNAVAKGRSADFPLAHKESDRTRETRGNLEKVKLAVFIAEKLNHKVESKKKIVIENLREKCGFHAFILSVRLSVENAGEVRTYRCGTENPVRNACGAVPERKWVVGGYIANATCASFRFRPQGVTSAAFLIGVDHG